MDSAVLTDSISRRFRSPGISTIFARTMSRDPIAISRVISAPTWTDPLPEDPAFAIHVQLGPRTRGEMFIDGHAIGLAPQLPGAVRVVNLEASPYAHIQEDADFLRLRITQRTLDDLSYDRGDKPLGSLRQVFNAYDDVLHGLARALMAHSDIHSPSDQLFVDHVAMAFHAHIIRTYANACRGETPRGGLAPWQLRRACDMMVANIEGNISIAELAQACDLSMSHFAQAFRQTVGKPPHRWLMQERIKRAKHMLRFSLMALSSIALACGFVDQSHLTRVFTRVEGMPPGRWRKTYRD